MIRLFFMAMATMMVLILGFFGCLYYATTLSSPLFYSGDYFVAADRMPWVWTPGGLNSAHEFGMQDGKGPLGLDLSRVGVQPGQSLLLNYVEGTVYLGKTGQTAGPDGVPSNGPVETGFGASSKPLPGGYAMPPANAPGALIFAFTDAAGQLVAAPFARGANWVQVTVPPRAQTLQLGINAESFAGNKGYFLVVVAPAPPDGSLAQRTVQIPPGACIPYNGGTICGSPNAVTSITLGVTVISLQLYY